MTLKRVSKVKRSPYLYVLKFSIPIRCGMSQVGSEILAIAMNK